MLYYRVQREQTVAAMAVDAAFLPRGSPAVAPPRKSRPMIIMIIIIIIIMIMIIVVIMMMMMI